jgi:hypothetical protein
MSKPRTYKLAANPVRAPRRYLQREITETDPAGHRQVVLVVPEAVAMDVLEALRLAYQNGREDLAAERADEEARARRDAGRPWYPVEVRLPRQTHPQSPSRREGSE